ncbi:MAG TPA: AgmX/PglI C-terminal domain-containing protein, partial [Polyangiales bacterium]|nr:AgmX/PglI C-terminal domain-containing protein [Polyangiales bacterium]
SIAPPKSGMQVEGILGTIPQRKIEETMQGKLPQLQRCFFEGMGQVEYLSGFIKFYFHVELDGRVGYVHPRGSSIGHRATELCLLEVAKKTRFPAPKGGGPAEFVWGFELESPGGVRAPVDWDEGRVAGAVSEQQASLASCGVDGAHYVITLYVAPGGSVQAAGAAADSQSAADKIDCVLSAVSSWRLPDPGSYAAKVSFKL